MNGTKTDRTSRENPPRPDEGLEDPVGRPHQGPGERDPLGLVGVEQDGVRRLPRTAASFQRQVHGVADAGVHPLAAGRAVDVPGIPGQEDPAVAEMVGDPVVDAVLREPVHPRHPRPGHLLDLPAEVVERQVIAVLEGSGTTPMNRNMPRSRTGKARQKVRSAR